MSIAEEYQVSIAQPTQEAYRQTLERRIEASRKHRRRFEIAWLEAQFFAAGKQWIEFNPTTRRFRVLETERPGVHRRTHDVLTQYLWTIIGALAQGEFRPEFLFEKDDVEAQDVADVLNTAMSYGWESEWHGDAVIQKLLLYLAVYGTGAVRCRYDRTRGQMLAHKVPHVDGKPVLDQALGHQVMEQALSQGRSPDLRPLREGRICWEPLSPWNLLPPPGVENEDNFPWEIIVRPVHVEIVRSTYGAGAGIKAEALDSMDVLGITDDRTTGGPATGALEDHVLVYTCYERPSDRYPDGATSVMASDRLLDFQQSLPYHDSGQKSGMVYFGYWPVPGQFWHRGFMSAGIEPQKGLNKRETQIDEWIDRSMPWLAIQESVLRRFKPPSGKVMELVPVPDGGQPPVQQGTTGPGPWMVTDAERRKEAVADALGVKDVALGERPPGDLNYSMLALLREAEQTKLGPVAQRFRLGIAELAKVTVEAMKQWPPGKKLMVVSDEDKVELLQWDASKLPEQFMARPTSTASQPSGLGAELAKINDLWNAAQVSGLVMQKPRAWFDWYRSSLMAGKAIDPPDDSMAEQLHMAALENGVMSHSGEAVPVRPTDNHDVHLSEHQTKSAELQQELTLQPDPQTLQALQAIEQHSAEHQAYQQQSMPPAGSAPVAPQGPPGPLPGPVPPVQAVPPAA